MKIFTSLLTVILFLTLKAEAQSPNLIWAKTFGDSTAFNQSLDSEVDNSGNLFVVGYSTLWPHGDYLILKYDASNGDTIWTKRFNSNPGNPANDNDIAMGCVVDDSGDLFVTGMSSNVSGNMDILTIKYNGNTGDTIWTRRFNGTANSYDAGTECELDAVGNLYVAGLTFTGAFTDFCLLKYNAANGNFIWSHNYPSPLGNKGEAYDCSLKGSNIFINGYIYDGSAYKLYTIKCNTSNGDTLWTRVNNETLDSLQFINSGCAADDSGNVYVVGNCSNSIKGVYGRLIKYDGAGNVVWSKIYESNSNDILNDALYECALDITGNFIATGSSNGPNTFVNHFVTLRYNGATGDNVWTKSYAGRGGVSCTVDALGYIYVTGLPGYWGCLTLKYDNTGMVSIKEENRQKKFRIYPNPSSSLAVLELTGDFESATLSVYNNEGQLIKQVNNISGKSFRFNQDNIPSGIYFLCLTQDNRILGTEKLIITD